MSTSRTVKTILRMDKKKGSGIGLNLEHITIAKALKSNGYTTAAYVKWHLGKNDLQIQNQRFDKGSKITYVGMINEKSSLQNSSTSFKWKALK